MLRIVACHPAMQMLKLSGNSNLGYEGVRMIGEELVNQTNLSEVDISCRNPWVDYPTPDSEEAQAQNKAVQQAGEALLKGIQQNVRITKLRISYLYFPPHVENDVRFYANLNKIRSCLLSTNHGLALTVWCYILAKCQSERAHKESLVYFVFCEQPTLVPKARENSAADAS